MAYDDRALRGVGGWLAFFVLTLAVFSPLRGALSLLQLLGAPTPPAFAEGWPAFRVVAIVEFVVGTGLAWFLSWRLVKVQNRSTPRIVIAGLWISLAIVQPILIFAGLTVSGVPTEVFMTGAVPSFAQSFIYNLIWTLYLLKSARVANTYTDEPADELHAVFE